MVLAHDRGMSKSTRRGAGTRRLRFALFGLLGVLPLACGGTATRNAGESGNSDDAGTSSGSSSVAGEHSTAGATSIAGGEAGNGVVMGGTGAGPRTIVCTSPTHDPVTGLVTCAEGYVHRPVAITCGSSAEGGAAGEGGVGRAEPSNLPRVSPNTEVISCSDDPTACAPFQHGYCRQYRLGRACYSGCVTDQDCGPGAICLCDDPASPTGGQCHRSSCGTDQDCQPGYTCASHPGGCDDGMAYACQKPTDTCEGQSDCGAQEVCQLQSDGRRACMAISHCAFTFP